MDEKEKWLDYYDDKECKYCGRQRVEISTKGRKVCEKCHKNQETGEYEPDKYI